MAREMLSIEESQQLMEKFIILRDNQNTPENITAFKKHEAKCIEAFMYLVTMKTRKYNQFSNYEDLNQDGLEALVKSMKNYDPAKGIFFWWAHKYIDTKIARSANLHTTIRYPLKVAKLFAPHKEAYLPIMTEKYNCPDIQLENSQVEAAITQASKFLTSEQREIINLNYGFDNKSISVNKICEKLNITRNSCIKKMNKALRTMKENIKI